MLVEFKSEMGCNDLCIYILYITCSIYRYRSFLIKTPGSKTQPVTTTKGFVF